MPGLPIVPGVRRSENSNEITLHDIRRVIIFIERCLELYIDKQEIVQVLEDQAQVHRDFTERVLELLEEENKEFFEDYYAALASREQQRQLMGTSSTANSPHPNHAVLSRRLEVILQPRSNGSLNGSASHDHAVSSEPNSNGGLTTTTSSTNGLHNQAVLSQHNSNGGLTTTTSSTNGLHNHAILSQPNSNGGLTTTTSSTNGLHNHAVVSRPYSNGGLTTTTSSTNGLQNHAVLSQPDSNGGLTRSASLSTYDGPPILDVSSQHNSNGA